MVEFSEVTRKVLTKAGWTPERLRDTTDDERLLAAEGYPVYPVVIEFLKRFGGLHLVHPHAIVKGALETTHFDIPKAIGAVRRSNVQNDSEDVRAPLCLIGQTSDGFSRLLMDPSGKVYFSYSTVAYVGSSGSDAIEALCTGRDCPIIP